MIALVQRPRRKTHLAVNHPGTTVWLTFGCDRELPTDGTVFTPIVDARQSIDVDDAGHVCVYCLRLLAFAHILLRNPAFTTPVPQRRLQAV